MRKNLLVIVLLILIISNFYIPQLAFSLNADSKLYNSTSHLNLNIVDQPQVIKSDTGKIYIKGSESIAPEKKFNYSNKVIGQQVSFDLKPISKRKFSVSFLNSNHSQVAVKIYDVIGNLIIEENVSGKGYFYKEYDLKFYNTDLFIIEVGNSKYNKTKSLVAG